MLRYIMSEMSLKRRQLWPCLARTLDISVYFQFRNLILAVIYRNLCFITKTNSVEIKFNEMISLPQILVFITSHLDESEKNHLYS